MDDVVADVVADNIIMGGVLGGQTWVLALFIWIIFRCVSSGSLGATHRLAFRGLHLRVFTSSHFRGVFMVANAQPP